MSPAPIVEREYIQWHTAAGCLVFMVGAAVSSIAVLAALRWLPDDGLVVVGVWAVVFVPFLRLSFWADRRQRQRRRSAEIR